MIGRSLRCDAVRHGRRLAAVLLAVVLMAGAASACSGGDDTPPTTAPPSTTIAPVVAVVGVPLTETYFSSLAQLPEIEPGAPVAAVPGSDASIFAHHQAAARRLLGLATPRTTEAALDGFVVCEADGGCSTYSGVVTEPASGRLTSFSVDGLPLTGRIAGSGPAADRDGIVVRVTSAYVSVGGDLFVVLDVANTSEFGVELFGFAAVLQPTGSSGPTASTEAAGAWGAATIDADSTGEMLLVFPASSLGGQFQLSGLRDDGLDLAFDVVVPAPAQ